MVAKVMCDIHPFHLRCVCHSDPGGVISVVNDVVVARHRQCESFPSI